jgi:CRISPR-associated protein Cmr3
MSGKLWKFEALDRLFFRNGHPFNAGEMAWLDSQFPPTGQTLQGAVRTAVLVHLGADFEAFRKGQPCVSDGRGGLCCLKDDLGDPSSLGKLDLTGPFVLKDGQLMFPAPLDLVKTDTGGYELLCVDEEKPIDCDLGKICLPRAKAVGVKTQDGKHLTAAAMAGYLAGDVKGVLAPTSQNDTAATLWPLFADDPEKPGLADREPKIGLEREDATRTAKEGMLYSIGFIRPRHDVSLGLVVSGLDPANTPAGKRVQALGGEGKLAGIEIGGEIGDKSAWPVMPTLTAQNSQLRFKLVFTTPTLFDKEGISWRPQGFAEDKSGSSTVWRGSLIVPNGTSIGDVEIVSACVGKPQKIGGWDMAMNNGKGGPRDLTCHLPAGSVYFCRAAESELANIRKLHGAKLGLKTEYGFGHVLIGIW